MSTEGTIPITTAQFFDPSVGRKNLTMPIGATIADIVAAALPGLGKDALPRVRVMLVNDASSIVIEKKNWHCVRPRAGAHVVIRLIPGDDALRGIMQVVVSVTAIALGQYWALGLGFKVGTHAFNMVSSLVGLGVTPIGGLQVNPLSPPA